MDITLDITAAKETEFAVRKLNATLEARVAQRTAELEALTTTLQNERNLMRTLIDSVPDNVFAKDAYSKCLLAKQSVARSMDTTPEQLPGKCDAALSLQPCPKAFTQMYRAS